LPTTTNVKIRRIHGGGTGIRLACSKKIFMDEQWIRVTATQVRQTPAQSEPERFPSLVENRLQPWRLTYFEHLVVRPIRSPFWIRYLNYSLKILAKLHRSAVVLRHTKPTAEEYMSAVECLFEKEVCADGGAVETRPEAKKPPGGSCKSPVAYLRITPGVFASHWVDFSVSLINSSTFRVILHRPFPIV
jgi:hypothetical protein